MIAARQALLCSCLSLALAACVAPPANEGGAGADGKAAAGPAKPKVDNPFDPDPVFAGEPVAKTELPGGILVEDFVIGEGKAAKTGAEVKINYYGTLEDGTMFDTSQKRNRPFGFTIGQGRVIKGWDQGVPGMKVGGKRRLTIPADLAYGKRARGKIPANATLIFELELVEMTPPLPPPQGPEAFAGEPQSSVARENGLIIEDFAVGTGREAKVGDEVAVHYTGTLDDGTTFDSSLKRNKAINFVLGTGRVIKGWEEGIAGMKVGGLRRLTIPAELGYGERSKGKIPANSRLTFTVELMRVRDAPKQTPARNRRGKPSRPVSH